MKIPNLNEFLSRKGHFAFKIENPKHAPQTHGIYFFTTEWEEDCFVDYVGSSHNLRKRITTHNRISEFKDRGDIFATIYVLPLTEYEYLAAEKYYIEKLRPTMNKVHKPRLNIEQLNIHKKGLLHG